MSGAGRYAPSPSGDLHFGNLRTAALAWLFARHTGRDFLLRIEDIDEARSSHESATRQLEDLKAIGIDWDGEPTYQSEHLGRYEQKLAELKEKGLTYECYCSRKDIQEATSAPHAKPGVYPGTCRDLTEVQRNQKRAELQEQGRRASIRIKSDRDTFTVHDFYHGDYTDDVDDFVIRRGGHAPDFAYNFVVVIDDGDSQVDQVVRGDDLLSSAPRQAWLAQLLGYDIPEYVHVPLVLNAEGKRLAKRDGAVTNREMGEGAVEKLCESLGYKADSLQEILPEFDPARLPRGPVTWTP